MKDGSIRIGDIIYGRAEDPRAIGPRRWRRARCWLRLFYRFSGLIGNPRVIISRDMSRIVADFAKLENHLASVTLSGIAPGMLTKRKKRDHENGPSPGW